MNKKDFLRADFDTQTWRNLKKHFETELEALRMSNDSNLNEVTTAHLRGRINQLKAIINLDKPDPASGRTD